MSRASHIVSEPPTHPQRSPPPTTTLPGDSSPALLMHGAMWFDGGGGEERAMPPPGRPTWRVGHADGAGLVVPVLFTPWKKINSLLVPLLHLLSVPSALAYQTVHQNDRVCLCCFYSTPKTSLLVKQEVEVRSKKLKRLAYGDIN